MTAKRSFSLPISYIVIPLLIAIGIFTFRMLNYLGAFKPVVITETKAGPFEMIYKTHIGAYHKIVPTIEEVEKWAKSQNIDCHLSFGEYLDNPTDTEEVRLRSHGGCIVSKTSTGAAIPEKLPEGFERQTVPEKNYVTGVFEGSPGIGPMKVYPKIVGYIVDHNLDKEETVLEIYEVHPDNSMTTTYYFPLKEGVNPTR